MSASVRAVLSFWDISFFSAFAERRDGGAPKDQVLEEVDVRQKENPNSTRCELWEPSDVNERDVARSVTLRAGGLTSCSRSAVSCCLAPS